MNEFDQYVKRNLKLQYYLRYADDFVIMHESRNHLESILLQIARFLETRLKLSLHPDKIHLQTLVAGVDFLGWVHFPHHRVLRTATKRRMVRKLAQSQTKETIASYLGLLSHGSTYKLKLKIEGNLTPPWRNQLRLVY